MITLGSSIAAGWFALILIAGWFAHRAKVRLPQDRDQRARDARRAEIRKMPWRDAAIAVTADAGVADIEAWLREGAR